MGQEELNITIIQLWMM